jgi:hypothetical protein
VLDKFAAAAWWRAPNARSTRWRRDASIVQLGGDAPQRRCARGTQRFNRAGNVGSPLAGAIRDTNLTGKDPAELWRFYIQLVEIEAACKTMKDDLQLRLIHHQLDDGGIFGGMLS